MKIGVAYYPEQWPVERWETDARLMKQLLIDVVRIGEFAWSRLEPKRERFEFDWLEQVVERLALQNLSVIMCTPTAAAPVWLFNRHPGMRIVGPDGRQWSYGSRRDACVNNAAYRKYARKIVTELVKRFAGNPAVWAWQVDNELAGSSAAVCYCDDCAQGFRQWLKRRYGTIERLNGKWGASFWSQEFNSFHDIPAPRRTPCGPHPSLALDYCRFTSAGYRSFLAEQVGIIKEYAGDDAVVTTNLPGGLLAAQVNHFSLGAEQDVISLDNYPADDDRLDLTAMNLDLARSVKRRPFWVMEQQAGATLVAGCPRQPAPGQLRLWSYQAAARGAEMISYFRWRTAAVGQEMHWYGMLDADGRPRRRFDELEHAIAEIKQRAPLWEGHMPAADVGIMLQYDAAWALEVTPIGVKLDYLAHVRALYGQLRRLGAQVEFVPPDADLAPYRVVVVPMPFVCTPRLAKQLEVFAFQGGRLLVTAPAGYKTAENTASAGPPPGELAGLLGVEVAEHDVPGVHAANTIEFSGGGSCAAGPFCSVMELRGAEALGTYGRRFYAGSPAATVRTVGDGRVFYLGASGGADAYRTMLALVLGGAQAQANQWASDEIEVIALAAGEGPGSLTFVLNHSPEPKSLPLPGAGPCRDLLADRECSGEVQLPGYGVALLQM